MLTLTVMKKLKLNSKLSLNKETISGLNENQMNDVRGGGVLSIGKHCTHAHNGCFGTDRIRNGSNEGG